MNLLSTNYNLGDSVGLKKLTIQGQSNNFNVYKIPLKDLVYNKKNGRIATYVSEYEEDEQKFPQDPEEFNAIIEDYIEKSNPNALKKTKANIEILGQTEPAVVLSNGIILDGNRRFTSLRQLNREGAGAQFEFLEAVILDSEKYNDKDIKRLELNLQHAIESRVDYNPIDRLVDIYRDLIENGGIFTPIEYAREIQSTEAKVKKEMELAQLMIDYLEYIGQPMKFPVARDQSIDGPIREIQSILNSKKIDQEEIDTIKEFLFLSLVSVKGDATRKIRDLRRVLENRNEFTKLMDRLEEEEILDDAFDYFEKKKEEVSNNKETITSKIKENLNEIIDDSIEISRISDAQSRPIALLKKAYKAVEEIDNESVRRMPNSLVSEFKLIQNRLIQALDKLGDMDAE